MSTTDDCYLDGCGTVWLPVRLYPHRDKAQMAVVQNPELWGDPNPASAAIRMVSGIVSDGMLQIVSVGTPYAGRWWQITPREAAR